MWRQRSERGPHVTSLYAPCYWTRPHTVALRRGFALIRADSARWLKWMEGQLSARSAVGGAAALSEQEEGQGRASCVSLHNGFNRRSELCVYVLFFFFLMVEMPLWLQREALLLAMFSLPLLSRAGWRRDIVCSGSCSPGGLTTLIGGSSSVPTSRETQEEKNKSVWSQWHLVMGSPQPVFLEHRLWNWCHTDWTF